LRYASRSHLRRGRFILSAAAAVLPLSACVSAEQAPASALSGIEEVPSPAAEGSGEPHLSSSVDGPVLSWLEPAGEGRHELKVSLWSEGRWSAPATVAGGDDWFVNWADFPSVVPVAPGVLVAHWLQRGGEGTYDYGVRVARSSDGGATWTEPWTPHEDGTPTEHGFVSIFPEPAGGWGLVWLDGREYASADGGEPSNEMTLRYRHVDAAGTPGGEVLVDGRICDCCQTDAAITSRGPLVVYRDRTHDEIRDVYVTRLVDGAWTEGAPLHADGWHIGGCPVNGPAASARDDGVAVAWFTGAGDQPRVKVSFSSDAGGSFAPPIGVDDGNPAGRVDVELLEDGSALVAWLERTGEGSAEVRVRRVWSDGRSGAASTVAASSSARASGFPQMVGTADGTFVFAWTDVGDAGSRVRVARAAVPR